MLSDQVLLAAIGTVTVVSSALVAIFVPVLNNRQLRRMQDAKDAANAKEKLAEVEAHRAEKLEDWARQDKVAQEARDVAQKVASDSRRLLDRQDVLANKADEAGVAAAEAAKLLLKTNEEMRQAGAAISDKLVLIDTQGKAIHTLVNSGYTEVMKSELRGLKRELDLLLTMGEMKRTAGTPGEANDASIVAVTAQIAELETNIKSRQDAAAAILAAESK